MLSHLFLQLYWGGQCRRKNVAIADEAPFKPRIKERIILELWKGSVSARSYLERKELNIYLGPRIFLPLSNTVAYLSLTFYLAKTKARVKISVERIKWKLNRYKRKGRKMSRKLWSDYYLRITAYF